MLKGAQKQMIVVRTGDSKYFDEAYFVLRRGVESGRGHRSDLLSEANRILGECENAKRGRGCRRGRGRLFFLLGLLSGLLCAAAVLLPLLL